jgi:hypothetical protein
MPGTTSYSVPFDGTKLTWEITTYETTKKTAVASDASTTSNRCSNVAPRGVTTETEKIQVMNDRDISLYPNPSKDKIAVISNFEKLYEKETMLFDVNGRTYAVKISRRISDQSFELDLSSLKSGIYFLKIKTPTGYKTLRIIKG